MILLTGGVGYIGSHVCIALLAGLDVVAVDNLSNSNKASLNGYNLSVGGRLYFGTSTSGMKTRSTKPFVLAK
jgi:UDP-glucose 4-epimerase